VPVVWKAACRSTMRTRARGRPVVLIHGSVSGNRQWRALSEELRERYRVLEFLDAV
jgi:pimeloyl-ACP methyl ester carboxylesterase